MRALLGPKRTISTWLGAGHYKENHWEARRTAAPLRDFSRTIAPSEGRRNVIWRSRTKWRKEKSDLEKPHRWRKDFQPLKKERVRGSWGNPIHIHTTSYIFGERWLNSESGFGIGDNNCSSVLAWWYTLREFEVSVNSLGRRRSRLEEGE